MDKQSVLLKRMNAILSVGAFFYILQLRFIILRQVAIQPFVTIARIPER